MRAPRTRRRNPALFPASPAPALPSTGFRSVDNPCTL